MEAIVFIILQIFFATCTVLKIGAYSRISPSFSWLKFCHVTCLDQSCEQAKIFDGLKWGILVQWCGNLDWPQWGLAINHQNSITNGWNSECTFTSVLKLVAVIAVSSKNNTLSENCSLLRTNTVMAADKYPGIISCQTGGGYCLCLAFLSG